MAKKPKKDEKPSELSPAERLKREEELVKQLMSSPPPEWLVKARDRRKENQARVKDHKHYEGLRELANASQAMIPLLNRINDGAAGQVWEDFVGACQRFWEATTVIDEMIELRTKSPAARQLDHNGHRLRVLIWEAGESIRLFDDSDRAVEAIRRAMWLTHSVMMAERIPVGDSLIEDKPEEDVDAFIYDFVKAASSRVVTQKKIVEACAKADKGGETMIRNEALPRMVRGRWLNHHRSNPRGYSLGK